MDEEGVCRSKGECEREGSEWRRASGCDFEVGLGLDFGLGLVFGVCLGFCLGLCLGLEVGFLWILRSSSAVSWVTETALLGVAWGGCSMREESRACVLAGIADTGLSAMAGRGRGVRDDVTTTSGKSSTRERSATMRRSTWRRVARLFSILWP